MERKAVTLSVLKILIKSRWNNTLLRSLILPINFCYFIFTNSYKVIIKIIMITL